MATLIIEGNADLGGPGRIGVGTGKVVPAAGGFPELPAYPSLIVSGNLDVSNKWGFGGSVWVLGNADFRNGSNVELYGLLQVGGNLDIGNGGKLDIVIKNPLVSTSGAISLAAPTSSRTIR
jgi:hypothetical protein